MSLNSFRSGMGRLSLHPVAKTILFIIGALLVFALVYSGLGSNLGGNTSSPDQGAQDVIATVNGSPITQADFDQTESNLIQQMQQMGSPPPGPTQQYLMDSETLNQLISNQEQIEKAQQMGITASSQEIAQARQQAATQDQIAAKLSLPPTATVQQIDDALTKSGDGTLEDIFPDSSLRNAIILNKLQQSFNKPVTPADALAYYKEYHTQHILISNQSVSDAQAQVQAQQILKKVLAPGASFSALAKQYSADPGTKDKGGDDGWIGEDNNFNNYVPQFVQAVQSLQVGQVTPAPVSVPQFGYFIIKLDGIRENTPKDFQKNQAKYLAQIQQQEAQTAYQNFLNSLKTDPSNKVVIKSPALLGDQDLAEAQQQANPTQRSAEFQAAITAYTTALKTASATDAGNINAALAQAYQAMAMIPQAIAADKACVAETHDQTVELALGQLYQQNHDTTEAIAMDEAASQQAWDDPAVHQQLAAAFTQMGQPALAAKETAQYQQITKRQKQMSAASPTNLSLSGGGQPITVGGNGAPQTVTVQPAAGKPAKTPSAPAQ